MTLPAIVSLFLLDTINLLDVAAAAPFYTETRLVARCDEIIGFFGSDATLRAHGVAETVNL